MKKAVFLSASSQSGQLTLLSGILGNGILGGGGTTGGPAPILLLGGVGGGPGDPSGLADILFLAGRGGGGIGGNDDANDSGRGGNAGTLRLDNIAECGRPADV